MEHTYPLLVSLYKGEGRILIVPIIDHVAGYSIYADWFVNITDMEKPSKIGSEVMNAIEYIMKCPLSTLTPKEREQNAAWKKNTKYKSKNSFWNNNHHALIKVMEDGRYLIYSQKKSEEHKGAYGDVIKEIALSADAKVEEIGEAVIDVFLELELYYNKKQFKEKGQSKEILLLDGKKIVVNLPWQKEWIDYQDGGSAEIYQNYKYLSNNGEVLAEIFWGIAPELDCELSRDNILTSWHDIYGKLIYCKCMPVVDSIFTVRAEMNNADLHKVSYYVKMAEDLLLECGLQVYKQNVSDKQREKFVKLFEELIVNSKLK